MRTIIDVLQQGSRELFHSAIIAWLLRPDGEHALGSLLLEGFARKAEAKGFSELTEALKNLGPGEVKTEVSTYRGRYDIVIEFGSKKFVVENKTRSIGEACHLDRYSGKDIFVMGLGFCEVSFSPDTYERYPVLTYDDVLDVLQGIEVAQSDFGVLVRHYRTFLERELSTLKLVVEGYANGSENGRNEVRMRLESGLSSGIYTANDIRFVNWYFLERFRLRLVGKPEWRSAGWVVEKNQQSGVWMANYESLPERYAFNRSVEEVRQRFGALLWFHIELWDGVRALGGKRAGMLQLRCGSRDERGLQGRAEELREAFRAVVPVEEGVYYRSRPVSEAASFYLVGENLHGTDLSFDQLENRLVRFCRRFGEFGGWA